MSIINKLNIILENENKMGKFLNSFKNLPPEEKSKLKDNKFDPSERKKARDAIDNLISDMDDQKAIERINIIDSKIDKLDGKLNNNILKNIKTTISMIKDGLEGKYPIPKRTIFMIIANILYIVSPIDVLPEILLGPIGYIDDVGVWASLFPAIKHDLADYLSWKLKNKQNNDK